MSDQPPPGQNPYHPYPPYGQGPQPGGQPGVPWGPPPDHPDAATVLILGILGMTACQVCAPFAWVKGSRVKREIEGAGGRYGGRTQVQIGYVLGIVGTCLLIFYVVGFVFYIAVVILALAGGAAA